MTHISPLTDTPRERAEAAIGYLAEAAAAVAAALNAITRAEDDRALIKVAAIKRLMESGAATSATAAEKIVEADPIYAQHRATQRELECEKWRALGAFEAAKLSAKLAVRLVGADE